MSIENEINNLNEPQKLAVTEKKSKRLLVLAGAGSGKTRVLTVRIAYLLSFNINPKNIFAVTFTNKAAGEMRERIIKFADDKNLSEMWIGTFHSLALRMIKDNIGKTDLSNNFTILDDGDQKTLIKNTLLEISSESPEKITHKIDSIKDEIKDIQSFIVGCKDSELRPNQCKDYLKNRGMPDSYEFIYERYEEKRIKNNACDFSDLILYAVEILRDNKEVQKYYIDKFKYTFVDEFQDTNPIQYRLIDLISSENTYQTMVGDDDQLIYSWRGANVDNLIKYKKNNSNKVKIIALEQNYRSTKNILEVANEIVKANKQRIKKKLWSDKEEGSKITVFENNNQFSEADSVVFKIKKLISEGYKLGDITILYRNNYLSNSFENKLTKERIAYRVIGGLSFWQRKEVKDILSYLSLIHDYNNDLSFERIINVPKRGVGKAALEKIKSNAYKNKTNLFQALYSLNKDNAFSKKLSQKMTHFIYKMEEYSSNNYALYELIGDIMEDFDLMSEYQKEDIEKRDERLANMRELQNYSRFYGENSDNGINLSTFLQNSILQSDARNDKDVDAVNLMTIHAAKGLEFKNIFIVGFEDGIFPSSRAILMEEKNLNLMEEERRLAYVAITRAEVNLFISFAKSRYNQNSFSSRFLEKIPESLIDFRTDSPYGLSAFGQKMRNYEKLQNKVDENDSNTPYVVGDLFVDEMLGDGEVIGVEKYNKGYIVEVDFGFLGIKKFKV